MGVTGKSIEWRQGRGRPPPRQPHPQWRYLHGPLDRDLLIAQPFQQLHSWYSIKTRTNCTLFSIGYRHALPPPSGAGNDFPGGEGARAPKVRVFYGPVSRDLSWLWRMFELEMLPVSNRDDSSELEQEYYQVGVAQFAKNPCMGLPSGDIVTPWSGRAHNRFHPLNLWVERSNRCFSPQEACRRRSAARAAPSARGAGSRPGPRRCSAALPAPRR